MLAKIQVLIVTVVKIKLMKVILKSIQNKLITRFVWLHAHILTPIDEKGTNFEIFTP